MKKLLALLLVMIMVVSMAACAPAEPAGTTAGKLADTTTAANKETTAPTTTEGEHPAWLDPEYTDLTGIVEDNTLTIGLPLSTSVLSYEENDFTKWLEERTGLEIKFVFFSGNADENRQQLNLMIANQETLPDLVLGIANDAMYSELGELGMLCDITEFMQKSPRLAQWQEYMTDYERNNLWNQITDAATGEIYAIPSFYLNNGVDSNEWIVGISDVMAKNVGLDASKIDTIDEVYEYLNKTVNEDGNGEKDEIGLIFMQNDYRSNAELWLINAYVFCSDAYLFNATDGEIWLPYNTDEYRQALITMNKWCAEGLISDLSYSLAGTNELKAIVDRNTENPTYIATAWGGHPAIMCYYMSQGGFAGKYYTGGLTLADETGKGGYANLMNTYVVNKAGFVPMNEEEPERMELAYLFCDLMYTWEGWLHARYGVEGENWEWIDGEALGLKDRNGQWSSFRILKDTWGFEQDDHWRYNFIQADASGAIAAGFHGGKEPLNLQEIMDKGDSDRIAYECLWDKNAKEQPAELIYDLVYSGEELEIMNEYKTLYKEHVLESRAKFVIGILDPNNDADWNTYLKELKLLGEDLMLEAAQAAYDRMIG